MLNLDALWREWSRRGSRHAAPSSIWTSISLADATRRGDGGTQPVGIFCMPFCSRSRGFATVEPFNVPASIGMQARDPTSDAIEGEEHKMGAERIMRRFIVYWALKPPSTRMSWPVVKAAPGELSQRTALAISSGVPTRPTGFCASIAFFMSV
jgi:hypothetical protein